MTSLGARTSILAITGALAAAAVGASGCDAEPPPVIELPRPASLDNPVPLSGGTLTLTRDGERAVMSDPGLDQVVVLRIADAGQELEASYALEPGDEPGRIVEGADDLMYVALRGAGAIARIDLSTGDMSQKAVCPAPRGLAFDAESQSLYVACTGGELVTLDANLDVTRSLMLDRDLRDVAVTGDKLVVTRFRAAELLVLDADGAIEHRLTPHEFISELDGRTFKPAVAYQLRVLGDGTVAMLHQRAFTGEVPIGGGDEIDGSPYGGSCDQAIVHAALTVFDPAIGAVVNLPNTGGLGTLVLPVDAAISSDGRVAAVGAGNDRVVEMPVGDSLNRDAMNDCFATTELKVLGEPVAIAYAPSGELLVQTRQPAALHRLNMNEVAPDEFGISLVIASSATTELSGPNRRHTGHALFHKAASAFSPIACASCHPEGRDDGLTWTFESIGRRRTQNISGGLLDTLPLHWDGEFSSMHELVGEVFVHRMGGQDMTDDRVDELAAWMHQLPIVALSAPADTDAVTRGEALYHDAEVGCATCHSGRALTNNATVSVGTGPALQVPTLRGVSHRAPFMHDGCAATLMDRFSEPCGGGDAHGKTSHLSESQLEDLVAYLETL